MADSLVLKRLTRDRLAAELEILKNEIRIDEINLEKQKVRDGIDKYQKQMSGLVPPQPSSLLITKRFEREKLGLLSQIQSLEIRDLELDEEIQRHQDTISVQRQQIDAILLNIRQLGDIK